MEPEVGDGRTNERGFVGEINDAMSLYYVARATTIPYQLLKKDTVCSSFIEPEDIDIDKNHGSWIIHDFNLFFGWVVYHLTHTLKLDISSLSRSSTVLCLDTRFLTRKGLSCRLVDCMNISHSRTICQYKRA